METIQIDAEQALRDLAHSQIELITENPFQELNISLIKSGGLEVLIIGPSDEGGVLNFQYTGPDSLGKSRIVDSIISKAEGGYTDVTLKECLGRNKYLHLRIHQRKDTLPNIEFQQASYRDYNFERTQMLFDSDIYPE
jgi:hypothetical protein